MKIAFLCIGLEAGKDGVGDYVRQFGQNLVREGHQCLLVALCDRFVRSPHVHIDPVHGFEVVRLPRELWAVGNTRAVEEALRAFGPDWISLQMVCYGYEHRGLLWQSARLFARFRRARTHMMFHELWIGESDEYGLRDRCVGWLQKQLLLRATSLWSPEVVHTSNPLYRELLRRNGVDAEELPLPGNIPIGTTDRAADRRWLLERAGLDASDDSSRLLAGVFGSVHARWGEIGSLLQLNDVCRSSGRRLTVIHIGRAGAQGEVTLQELRHRLQGQVDFHALGELRAADVSRALLALDLGIATTPWPLVGKSGSVAAMLEHGLPVVVTRDDFRLRVGVAPAPTPHPLLHLLDEGCAERLRLAELTKGPARARDDIYRRFVQSLSERVSPLEAHAAEVHATVTARH